MTPIFLKETDSTNQYLKSLLKKGALKDGDCVIATAQTAGKGQMGNGWLSESGRSLTFSIYKEFASFPVQDQFKIAMSVSLAIQKVLSIYADSVSIKWPNDLIINGKKIGGVLIENKIKGTSLTAAMIGIGLNIFDFPMPDLPRASSLQAQSKRSLEINAVLEMLLICLEQALEEIPLRSYQSYQYSYEKQLFSRGVFKTFMSPYQGSFEAKILGVSHLGALNLEKRDGSVASYQLKEIAMQY